MTVKCKHERFCDFTMFNVAFNTKNLNIGINPNKPDGVSQRHTLHLIGSHFYMNGENEVYFHEF